MRYTVHLILIAILPAFLGRPDSVLAEHVGSKLQEVHCAWPEDYRVLRKGFYLKRSRVEMHRKSRRMSTPEYDPALLQELISSASPGHLSGRITQGKPDTSGRSSVEQGNVILEKLLSD